MSDKDDFRVQNFVCMFAINNPKKIIDWTESRKPFRNQDFLNFTQALNDFCEKNYTSKKLYKVNP